MHALSLETETFASNRAVARARGNPFGGSDTDADRILRERSATVLRVAPQAILEALPRLGELRFVTGNDAVHVEHTAAPRAVGAGGLPIELGDGIELWPFARNWRLALAVEEPHPAPSLVSLRFFDQWGARALEVHVSPKSDGGQRIRDHIARWRTGYFDPPPFDRDPRAPLGRDLVSSPGLESTLRNARKFGDEATLRTLETRHGLSRLEALSMVGEAWARRVRCFDLHDILCAVARGRLSTRLLVGNPGVSYMRSGSVPYPRRHGHTIRLRDDGLALDLREGAIAELWVVRLRGGCDVTSLEAFDENGDPAFLMFGARDGAGRQSPEWRAFLDRIERPAGEELGR